MHADRRTDAHHLPLHHGPGDEPGLLLSVCTLPRMSARPEPRRRGPHEWQAGVVHPLSDAEFDTRVEDALDQVPEELMAMLDNVVFLVEDEPPADDSDLLGVYEGVPLTERGDGWAAGALPDRILLFRGPLTRMCADDEELTEEIAVTVVHEIAHHFGIDDATLHDLGWG